MLWYTITEYSSQIYCRMHSVALTHPTHIPERVKSPWYLVDVELLLDRIYAVNLSAEDVSLSLRAVKDFTSCLSRHKYTECKCYYYTTRWK